MTTTTDRDQARLDAEDMTARWERLLQLERAVSTARERKAEVRSLYATACDELRRAELKRTEFLEAQTRPLPLFDRPPENGAAVKAEEEIDLPSSYDTPHGPLHLRRLTSGSFWVRDVCGVEYSCIESGAAPHTHHFPCCPQPGCRALLPIENALPPGNYECTCKNHRVDLARDTQGAARLTLARDRQPTPAELALDDLLDRHPGQLLLFRAGGGMYEFRVPEHQQEAFRGGLAVWRFPHADLERHLKTLLAAGKRVAICEPVESPGGAKRIIIPQTERVVTPGRIEDEPIKSSAVLDAAVREKWWVRAILDPRINPLPDDIDVFLAGDEITRTHRDELPSVRDRAGFNVMWEAMIDRIGKLKAVPMSATQTVDTPSEPPVPKTSFVAAFTKQKKPSKSRQRKGESASAFQERRDREAGVVPAGPVPEPPKHKEQKTPCAVCGCRPLAGEINWAGDRCGPCKRATDLGEIILKGDGYRAVGRLHALPDRVILRAEHGKFGNWQVDNLPEAERRPTLLRVLEACEARTGRDLIERDIRDVDGGLVIEFDIAQPRPQVPAGELFAVEEAKPNLAHSERM